ncbi:MAG TPA: phenylalanine--tRNA ligase beta subunit-related protein [Candidatus Polarisedimenticolaceae bacterium]|nr:phenylalanine--tRNA ligase beta subunit-related protein [Candidatus Polarisedimenticolaceae bacterium]
MPELTIAPDIRQLVSAAVVAAEGLRIGAAGPNLTAEIDALAASLRAAYSGKSPGEIPGLSAARTLYRAFGLDPTSTRPSSEALVRRVLQGKPFPAVNAAVDVANLCSATFLLPIGLYDAAKIDGPVILRRGAPGESYPGIRKDDVHLDGRPVLSDRVGPFGNPSSDSARTAVDAATVSLLMVVFAPAGYDPAALISHEVFAQNAIDRHLRRA